LRIPDCGLRIRRSLGGFQQGQTEEVKGSGRADRGGRREEERGLRPVTRGELRRSLDGGAYPDVAEQVVGPARVDAARPGPVRGGHLGSSLLAVRRLARPDLDGPFLLAGAGVWRAPARPWAGEGEMRRVR